MLARKRGWAGQATASSLLQRILTMMVGQIFTLLESIIIFCTATITTEHLRMSPKRPAYPVLTPQARNYSLSRQRGLITTMMVVSIYSWRTILTGHLRRQRPVVARGTA